MKLLLLTAYYLIATRNERSAMVRLSNTKTGKTLFVRAGRLNIQVR